MHGYISWIVTLYRTSSAFGCFGGGSRNIIVSLPNRLLYTWVSRKTQTKAQLKINYQNLQGSMYNLFPATLCIWIDHLHVQKVYYISWPSHPFVFFFKVDLSSHPFIPALEMRLQVEFMEIHSDLIASSNVRNGTQPWSDPRKITKRTAMVMTMQKSLARGFVWWRSCRWGVI